MKERIKDKIDEIEKELGELNLIVPDNFENYQTDFKSKAACERYAEIIIESLVDLAFLVIRDKNLPTPESDLMAFDILFNHGIIDLEFSEKLKDAKRMRNILAHEYGRIDDSLVFEALTEQLIPDTRKFIKEIKTFLEVN